MCVFLCCFVVQKTQAKCDSRIFENLRARQKQRQETKKKRVSFGPADKKRTQFNFLTEKVRARANKVHILLYAQQ